MPFLVLPRWRTFPCPAMPRKALVANAANVTGRFHGCIRLRRRGSDGSLTRICASAHARDVPARLDGPASSSNTSVSSASGSKPNKPTTKLSNDPMAHAPATVECSIPGATGAPGRQLDGQALTIARSSAGPCVVGTAGSAAGRAAVPCGSRNIGRPMVMPSWPACGLAPVGAEQPVPPRQIEAEIAVGLMAHDRMVHAMHVGRDHASAAARGRAMPASRRWND